MFSWYRWFIFLLQRAVFKIGSLYPNSSAFPYLLCRDYTLYRMKMLLTRLFTLFYACFFQSAGYIRQEKRLSSAFLIVVRSDQNVSTICHFKVSLISSQSIPVAFCCLCVTTRLLATAGELNLNKFHCSPLKNIITVLFTLRPLATLYFWQDVKVQLLCLHSFQVVKGALHSFLTKGVFASSLHWDTGPLMLSYLI